ncbi:MAG: DUF5685 family protein [Lachnospiraceae bacterium]
MFGYIDVNKKELKIREFEEYRSYYCGLCNILEQKHGLVGKMTLTYDMTFLYLLLSGLYEPKEKCLTKFCPAHPMQKCQLTINRISEYVADMNIILFYYKCQDNIQDERSWKAKTGTIFLQKDFERVAEKYPEKISVIKKKITENSQLESQGETNLDKMAGITGEIMAEIYAYKTDEWENILRRMGFFLGKFIYLMDAWDDLEEDIESKNYNVLKNYQKHENFDKWCRDLMIMMISECTRAFEELPILKNAEILRNILYAGVWNRYKDKMKKRMEEKKDGSV